MARHHEGPERGGRRGSCLAWGTGDQRDPAVSQRRWQLPPPMLRGGSWPQREVRLLCSGYASSNGKKIISLRDRQRRAGGCLTPGCCFSLGACEVGMGSREVAGDFWAESLLLAGAEHTGRSNALSRDLPAATRELWCDVLQHGPRHARLRGTGNCW